MSTGQYPFIPFSVFPEAPRLQCMHYLGSPLKQHTLSQQIGIGLIDVVLDDDSNKIIGLHFVFGKRLSLT